MASPDQLEAFRNARRIRVCIPTTDGVVDVLGIVRENSALAGSVVRIGFKLSEAFGLDAAYNAFVNAPGGLIERHFGHNRFRVDLSDRIEAGNSWQLGMFLAHALHHADRLAGSGPADTANDDGAPIVWATGELRIDQKVTEVTEIPAKLRASRALISDARARGAPILVCLPESGLRDTETTGALAAFDGGGLVTLGLNQVNEALTALGLRTLITYRAAATADVPPLRKAASTQSHQAPWVLSAAVVATGVVILLAIVVGLRFFR